MPSIVPLALASFILPLCTNVMVTALIIGRIWWMSKDTALYELPTRSTTRAAISVMIESGALYFIVQLIFVVIFGINHPAEVIMILIATQTYVSLVHCADTLGDADVGRSVRASPLR